MKLKVLTTTLVLAAAMMLGFTGCKSSNSTKSAAGSDLRLKFKAGETYTLTTTIDQDIEQEIPQMPTLNFQQMLKLGLSFHVVNVDSSGNYNIDVTYKNLAYKITGLPDSIEFDSDSSDNKDFPLAGIVGKTYHMTVSPSGKVANIKGADEIIDTLVDNMNAPPAVKAVLSKEALKNQFGDNATKELMNNLVGTFPDRLVKEGEHWQQELELRYGYPVKMNIEYSLDKASNNTATIGVKAQRQPLAEAPTMNIGNISFSYELRGEDTGELKVDLNTGWITDGTMDSSLSGKVIVAPTQDLPEGLTWPIKIQGKIELKGEGPLKK